MALKVTVKEKSPGVFNVVPTGSLDSVTHSILENQLEPIVGTKPRMIVFDMKELKYISSIGLRIIFKTNKTLKNHGGEIALLHMQPQIEEVFKIVKALPTEQVFVSVEELDNYLMLMQQKKIAGN